MTQEELIQIVKQINTVDLYGEAKDALTAKVLKLAADSVTLETLKALLAPAATKETVPQGAVAMTLGRKSRPGFTLSKKEIKPPRLFWCCYTSGCGVRNSKRSLSKTRCSPAPRARQRWAGAKSNAPFLSRPCSAASCPL